MYKSQQRIGSERVMKRNAEIKKLRDENEKLTSLVRKSEERINQLFDAKEKEKHERMRADRLADQLFGKFNLIVNDIYIYVNLVIRLLVCSGMKDHVDNTISGSKRQESFREQRPNKCITRYTLYIVRRVVFVFKYQSTPKL